MVGLSVGGWSSICGISFGGARLQKDEYTLAGGSIQHSVFQGALVSLNQTVAVTKDLTKVRHIKKVYLYRGPNANLLLSAEDYTDGLRWEVTSDDPSTFIANNVTTFNSVGSVPISNDGVASTIVYTEVGTPRDVGGLHTTYAPREDLLYVWVEGQDKTQTTITKYEKKSFNLFGDNAFADLLARDNSYKWREINYNDQQPLLESDDLPA